MVLAGSLGKGGTERVFSLLLDRFDRSRFAPEAAIFDLPISYDIPTDVPVHILSQRPASRSPIGIGVPDDLKASNAAALEWMGVVAAKLADLVNERQPDVIVASPLWASIMAFVASERFPASTGLVNIAGAPPTFWLSDHPQAALFGHILRENLNRSDRVVAVSRAIADDLICNYGVDPSLTTVIHTPSNISSIEALAQEPVEDATIFDAVPTILFVGRLEPVKGVEYLLEAVADVLKHAPVRCLLVGEGSQKGYLVAFAKHLGITDHVRFLGQQDNPFKFMSKASMFVLSSVSEGMPNVLLEAMACGCPVIATDIEGGVTREVLEDGRCGRIVPLKDPSALAHAIVEMLEDPELRVRFAEEGSRRAREFDLPRIVSEFEDTISAVASGEVSRLAHPRASAVLGGRAAGSERSNPDLHRPALGGLRSTKARLASVFIATARPAARAVRGLERRVRGAVEGRMLRSSARGMRSGHPGTPAEQGSAFGHGTRLMVLAQMMTPGSAAETLSKYLTRRGLDVFLVSILEDPVRARIPQGVSHRSLARFWARSRIEPRHLTDPAIEGHADDLEWLAATASKAADAAVGWRADAILVDGYESARVALIAKRFLVPDLPVIVRAGSCLRDSTTGANSVVDSAILADYLRDAEAIAATTTALAEEAIAAYPSLRDNTLVIPSPIDREAALAGPSEDSADSRWLGGGAPLFLCALGEDADAGLRWLLETVSVAADRAAFRVAVVECGRRTPGFEEHVAAMGISEERVGFLSDSASLPGNLLESAAGFMYLGCEPGPEVPRQIVRAVAAGCPVIVPRGSLLVDELFDEGRLGLQVRIASPRALAEAMLQLLWDGDAGADLARCASERLEAMSAENVAARVDALVSAQVARTHP